MTWPTARLGSLLLDIQPGFASGEELDSGVLQVRMNNIKPEGAWDWTKKRYIPAKIRQVERYSLQLGDILFNATNSAEQVGKSALYSDHVEEVVCFSNHFLRLRVDSERLLPEYLVRFLGWLWGRRVFENMVNAWVNQATVRREDLVELRIPLPPLVEQRRITTILDKVDTIRRKRRQAIQLADDFLRGVFLDMFGDPATNPKGWPVHKMSEVIDFKGGSQPPKETFEYEEKEGYVRLVQIRDFRTDKFKTYIPLHLARRRFEVDDVMIGRYGPPVFQIFRGLSGSYNVALMKAIPRDGVTKDFVYRLLQLPTYQDAVISNSERTAGQSGVNLELLNSLDVPLPPADEQIAMSQKIRRAEAFIKKLRVQLDDAEQLFSSLSQSAFSGDL
ncbi:restriction endonuclease subunit S [Pseudomonas oryzihabitans]|uniref:restriction endonuclease subunit S n=1 Tax=Pseudomonas oryzihabitans TaxID=47885 RepID=UPI003F98E8D9